MTTPTPLAIVQNVYAAFGSGDLPKLLGHLATDCVWEFVGPASIPYCRRATSHEGIQRFFADVAANDDIQAFEPREFMVGADSVTVLGWERTIAKPTGRTFETDWVHVWQIKDGKVTRFKGFYDSAAVVESRRASA